MGFSEWEEWYDQSDCHLTIKILMDFWNLVDLSIFQKKKCVHNGVLA